jgi:sulfur-carrier protein
MRVLIPSALQSYTSQSWVHAEGETLGDVLVDLDLQYPGIRFRMVDEQRQLRPHIRFFYQGRGLTSLEDGLNGVDDLCIVQALSGG